MSDDMNAADARFQIFLAELASLRSSPSPVAIAEAVREAAYAAVTVEVHRVSAKIFGEPDFDKGVLRGIGLAISAIRSLDLSSILAGLGK